MMLLYDSGLWDKIDLNIYSPCIVVFYRKFMLVRCFFGKLSKWPDQISYIKTLNLICDPICGQMPNICRSNSKLWIVIYLMNSVTFWIFNMGSFQSTPYTFYLLILSVSLFLTPSLAVSFCCSVCACKHETKNILKSKFSDVWDQYSFVEAEVPYTYTL